MNFRLTGVAFATVLLVGCASAPDKDPQGRSDPLEGFNRTMFDFNYNVLDPYILRPVAVAWRDYVPMPARNGISNFTSNLEEPASMVNAFLKGDPYRGMIHFNRFFLNTLLGMGGLIDVAGMANPKLAREEPNRFGSTLGHYDVGYGPYVMLPGYGSFTLRDEGGDFADTLYPMLSYLTFWMSAGKWVVEGSKPAPSCWIPMVCCATLPILTSWCAKLTFSATISSPTAARSSRKRTRTPRRFRASWTTSTRSNHGRYANENPPSGGFYAGGKRRAKRFIAL